MNQLHKFVFLAVVLLCTITDVKAQEFTIFSQFNAIADNREFFSEYSNAETIFGSNMAIGAKLNVDSLQGVVMGVSNFYEFGSSFLEQPFFAVLNYSFDNNIYDFKIGAFLRSDIDPMLHAFVSERYGYYNPTIDGIYLKYRKPNHEESILVDWVSRQDSTKREQFLVHLGARQLYGNFIFEEMVYMFHNAHRTIRLPNEHIEDYLGLCLLVGYDFAPKTPLDILTIKTGTLISADRNRGEQMEFSINPVWYTVLKAEYKGYGIESYYKYGNKQQFILGDSFYNNASNYLRTSLYFTPIKFKNVEGRFLWSLHLANGDLDNQQQFKLIYTIQNK